MKKIAFVSIFVLILATSLVKNSTKEIEDNVFVLNENIRSLKVEFSEMTLDYNFLSAPDKLIEYQSQYFEKDLIKIDVMKIKEIVEKNSLIHTSYLVKKINDER